MDISKYHLWEWLVKPALSLNPKPYLHAKKTHETPSRVCSLLSSGLLAQLSKLFFASSISSPNQGPDFVPP